MISFTVTAGQVVDFDIDTATNGATGLQSYLRLFNSSGTQLAFNDDATAPGESTAGFDAFIRHTLRLPARITWRSPTIATPLTMR